MLQLKDLVTKKVNSNNKQISLDVKKIKLKDLDMDIDDILNLRIKK
jgi:hypothetical protein